MDLTFIISPLDLRGCDSCRKTCKEIAGKYRPSLGTELIRISFLLKIESLQIFVPSSEGWLLWCLCFFTEDMETQGGMYDQCRKRSPYSASSLSPAVHSGCQGQTCTDRTLANVPGPQPAGVRRGQGSAEGMTLLNLLSSHQDPQRGLSK